MVKKLTSGRSVAFAIICKKSLVQKSETKFVVNWFRNRLSGLYPFFAEENNALFRAILTEDLQVRLFSCRYVCNASQSSFSDMPNSFRILNGLASHLQLKAWCERCWKETSIEGPMLPLVSLTSG